MPNNGLSPQMVHALQALANGPCEVHNKTIGLWLSGQTAAALIRRGLARRRALFSDSGWHDYSAEKIVITDAGDQWLKTHSSETQEGNIRTDKTAHSISNRKQIVLPGSPKSAFNRVRAIMPEHLRNCVYLSNGYIKVCGPHGQEALASFNNASVQASVEWMANRRKRRKRRFILDPLTGAVLHEY